jgi:phosphate transport system permease protein
MITPDQALTTENTLKTEGRFSRPSAAPRTRRDRTARRTFFFITLLPVAFILLITVALFLRAWPIVSTHHLTELLFNREWQPSAGKFGFWPFIVSTIWVTVVGIILSVPACLLVATYLAEYARASTRAFAKPILDVLAAIPPVVYGVWGLLAIVPFVDEVLLPFSKRWLNSIPFLAVNQPTGFGILSAGIVLAVMIAPLIISIVYEVFATVPNDLRQASLAVGATQWQTIRNVVFPQVSPGIVAAVVLGASRALGETIAVLIVVGNVAKVPTSIFDSAYPLPALIANNYGDMMSIPLYDAALLGAALVLLVVILFFNITSQLILHRFILRRK